MDSVLSSWLPTPKQAVAVLALLYIAHALVYAFVLSPVHHVPGPWWARLSKLPLLLATFQRRRSQYASDLLAKYGSVVVIAPDQIHTTDEEAMKIIYNRYAIKTSFYSGMGSWKGVKSTLGFVDYQSAAPTRNNLIQCFQNKNLATLVENMSSHINEFCDVLRSKANQDIDGVVLFRLLALDIVTDVLWGETKTLLSSMSDSTPAFLRRFHAFSSYNATKSFIPGFDSYVRFFGSAKWRELRQDCSDMDITAKEALARWETEGEHRDRDVLSMLRSMDAATDERKRVPSSHIPAYMVEMLAAGSSTTSHTATFVCWELTHHPEASEKLRMELAEAFPGEMEEQKLMDLPYLDAVIRETMRLMPMIPGPLERFLPESVEISGITIPAGVVASTAARDQGHLSEVFPRPDEWLPERWLNAPTERMHLNWTPFGYGSRACPGSNLAMTELKYMIGIIFRQFKVLPPVDPGRRQEKLDLGDVFVSGERSGHCWLRFESL
ncbi:hypothetical protein LTR10_003964 [Elasticomyces elasticus]|uniref:Cytochrome P450 n=1 Tax=Elasticomyces elasticus TaxID=574655 RepID=A0AAN7WHH6_9PEZI|nr:hypothetical protein LTR10_003964 [Elasticomyces elasticus]KAK4977849.1 hypothetical protein LTR42_002224 [Elasticomyces elasticus]KAK5706452.1 hypothetical protein LTR97_001440 [Elasticomyces elasticus]